MIVDKLLRTASIVHDLHDRSSILLSSSLRELYQGKSNQFRWLRDHPEISGNEDLMLSSSNQVSHVPRNVWNPRDNDQGAHAMTSYQRRSAQIDERVCLESTEDIMIDL